jgi:phenylacetate-coenzyme A ligase PaaK-like adenylate-forming protein
MVTGPAEGIRMKYAFDARDLEEAPLDKLVEFATSTLLGSGILRRAAMSGLYKARWQQARFSAGSFKDLSDLRRAPLTAESDLVRACHPSRIKSYACSYVQTWFRVTGKGGATWWLPCGRQDVMKMVGLCMRMSRVVEIASDDLALVLSHPAPAVSDSLPYFLGYAHKLTNNARLEIVPLSLMLLLHKPEWAAFLLKRQPTVLVSTPGEALQLAEILKSSCAGSQAAGETANAERRHPLERLRLALLFGNGLSQDRQRVAGEYGVEAFQMQGATDCLLLNVECRTHQGVHVWMDTCVAEIVPATDMDARSAEPQAVFLHEAKPGTKGELVVTTFGQALPLIRYRTGETVEMVSNERCPCGLSHPRVRFL